MKLLYCLCLESCFDESGNVADDMNDENLHLFTYFDYFMAYDNGPLERDIYEHITCLEGVKYEDGRIVAVDMFQTEDFNRNIELFLPLETAFRRIAAKGLLDLTVARLIELTHRLPLWRNAYNYGSTKDMNVNPFNIKMECDDYADMVNDNAA
ncbi:MAG: hypothetical protein J6B62_11130 [Bacteroidales bacterium]|nr:hypothetical protein [Bacteroidales bacterium]